MAAHRLCEVSELVESQPVQVTVAGVRVAVVRVGAEIFAIEDRCSHERSVALSDGEVDAFDCTIECWKHGSRFSLRTGAVLSMPATEDVSTFSAVTDSDGVVSVIVADQ